MSKCFCFLHSLNFLIDKWVVVLLLRILIFSIQYLLVALPVAHQQWQNWARVDDEEDPEGNNLDCEPLRSEWLSVLVCTSFTFVSETDHHRVDDHDNTEDSI